MIQNLLFDLGGVVVEFDPRAFLQERLGAVPHSELSHRLFALTFSGPAWKKLTLGKVEDSEFRAEVLQTARAENLETEARTILDEWAAILKDKPETIAFLPKLKEAGLHIFYLSNTEKSTLAMVEKRSYWPLWEGGVASCNVGLAKPDPAIFEFALQKLGLSAAETVLIDDNAGNVRAAQGCGLAAILYKNHAQLLRELAALDIQF